MGPFDRYAAEYDRWFDDNRGLYLAEIETLRRLVPGEGRGIEIGAGTGRFALTLQVTLAVEPSRQMAKMARARDVPVVQAVGERLPLADASFDCALLVTVLCFVADPMVVLREAARVLRPGGTVVVGLIDRHSDLGRAYEARREADRFYRHARFYGTYDVLDMLGRAGFWPQQTYQTIFGAPGEAAGSAPDVRPGHGEGAFVGVGAVLRPAGRGRR